MSYIIAPQNDLEVEAPFAGPVDNSGNLEVDDFDWNLFIALSNDLAQPKAPEPEASVLHDPNFWEGLEPALPMEAATNQQEAPEQEAAVDKMAGEPKAKNPKRKGMKPGYKYNSYSAPCRGCNCKAKFCECVDGYRA